MQISELPLLSVFAEKVHAPASVSCVPMRLFLYAIPPPHAAELLVIIQLVTEIFPSLPSPPLDVSPTLSKTAPP